MKKVLLLSLFVFASVICNAQCRQWIGEPYDSIHSIVSQIERLSFCKLNLQGRNKDSTSSFIQYQDSTNHIITVNISMKIVKELEPFGAKIIYKNKGISSIEIKMQIAEDRVKNIFEWVRSTITNCNNVRNGPSYSYFGKNRVSFFGSSIQITTE